MVGEDQAARGGGLKPYFEDYGVTLYLGDCLQITEWLQADVLVTDPPYGTEHLGGGYGRGAHFTIANDADDTVRDAALTLWGDRPRLAFGSPRAPEPPGEWRDRLVWDKREPGLNGGPWRYTHESIFVGGDGWVRQSAASFSILSFPSGNNSPAKSKHAHAKPIPLMESLIRSAPPGTICDPFAGSGSTLIAARNLGRSAIGVEWEEKHCETIALRLAEQTLFEGVF